MELNVQAGHVQVVLSIPLKVSVFGYMGTVRGNTTIKVFNSYPMLKKKPYWGNHFWARGYAVNTLGIYENLIRRYVEYQEEEERIEESNRQGFNFDM